MDNSLLSIEEIKEHVPSKFKPNITQELVDDLNNAVVYPEMGQIIQDNFLSYTSVLSTGKYKMSSYLSAVKYVSFKTMGKTNKAAYYLTFPDRKERHKEANLSESDVASLISAYNRGTLVNKITKAVLIPSSILNHQVFQEAINAQYRIITNPNSTDRNVIMAADSLMNHLKRPEPLEHNLNIGVTAGDDLVKLESALNELSRAKRAAIIEDNGYTAQDVINMKLQGNTYVET